MLIAIASSKHYWQQALRQAVTSSDLELVTVSAHSVPAGCALLICDEPDHLRLKTGVDELSLPKPVLLNKLVELVLLQLGKFCYRAAGLEFYPWRRIIDLPSVEGSIALTEKESCVLEMLLRAQPDMISKKKLLELVWHYSEDAETSTVESLIHRLRQKLAKYNLEQIIVSTDSAYTLRLSNRGFV